MIYTATVTRDGHVIARLSRSGEPYGQSEANDYPGCELLANGLRYASEDNPPDLASQLQGQLDDLEEQREKKIKRLRAVVAAALIGNGWTKDDTMEAGRRFFSVKDGHGAAIRSYIDGAAEDFAEDVVSDDRAWLGLFASPGVTIREVILAHVA